MGKFAKIIELDDKEQVLLTVNYEPIEQCYELHIRTDFTDVSGKLKLGFNTEAQAIAVMEKYDVENAKIHRLKMKNTFGG